MVRETPHYPHYVFKLHIMLLLVKKLHSVFNIIVYTYRYSKRVFFFRLWIYYESWYLFDNQTKVGNKKRRYEILYNYMYFKYYNTTHKINTYFIIHKINFEKWMILKILIHNWFLWIVCTRVGIHTFFSN